jgi:hypothetical protein
MTLPAKIRPEEGGAASVDAGARREKRGHEVIFGVRRNGLSVKRVPPGIAGIHVHAEHAFVRLEMSCFVGRQQVTLLTEPTLGLDDEIPYSAFGRIDEDTVEGTELPVILAAEIQSLERACRNLHVFRGEIAQAVRRTDSRIVCHICSPTYFESKRAAMAGE